MGEIEGGEMEDGEMWEGEGIWQWGRWKVGGVRGTGPSAPSLRRAGLDSGFLLF